MSTEKEVISCWSTDSHIILPDGVTSIGDRAFYWCTSLTSITIPNSVTSIGNAVFSCCFSLKSITIPDSVASIGAEAFGWLTGLREIRIPKGTREKMQKLLGEEYENILVEI